MLHQQGLVIEIPQGDLVPVLLLGLVNTGVGCYLYFSAISRLQVQTVAQHCGFLDVHYFSKVFKKYIGKTPKEFKVSSHTKQH